MVRNTETLIKTIKKFYPVMQFLKDRYFPDGRVYYSEKALIETKKKGRKIAPYVVPVVGGIAVESEGYRAYEVDAPYIAPKKAITAADLEKKAFGEKPDSGRTPADRENEIQAEYMDDLRTSIYRRQEQMCGELILTGKITMNHYASANDASSGKNPSVMMLKFYDGDFNNRYVFEKKFEEMGAGEKIQEFYKMASILRKRGIRATDILMASDVSMLLMSDKDFLDFYDKAWVEFGDISQVETPEGVVCNGRININGVVMTMFTYDEEYEDLDGTTKEVMPSGTIAFLHPDMGETVYAQVTLYSNKDESYHSYAERVIARTVGDEDSNVAEVQTFSRPVPYPYDWDGWLVANIHETAESGEIVSQSIEDGQDAGPEIRTEDEIRAMTKKADVIAYGESLGMTGLTDDMRLTELCDAVLNYQDEHFGEGDGV